MRKQGKKKRERAQIPNVHGGLEHFILREDRKKSCTWDPNPYVHGNGDQAYLVGHSINHDEPAVRS